VKLAARREGSGPTPVCHPGGPGFSASSLTDLGGLADSFELVLLDPRAATAPRFAPEYRQAIEAVWDAA
jgi:hypothetical protein